MAAQWKQLQRAIIAAEAMPVAQQDLLAAELMDRIHDLTRPAHRLSAEERTELEAALAEAARGEFATDEEVAAMWRGHGQ